MKKGSNMNFSERNRNAIEMYHNMEITRSMCCNTLYSINERLASASVLGGLDSPKATLFEGIHKYLDDYDKTKAQFITFLYYKLRSMAQDIRRKDVLVRVPRAKKLKLEYVELLENIPDKDNTDIVQSLQEWIELAELEERDVESVNILKEALSGKTRKELEKKFGRFGDILEKSLPFHKLGDV
jgi:hypothetical protein